MVVAKVKKLCLLCAFAHIFITFEYYVFYLKLNSLYRMANNNYHLKDDRS